MPCVASARSFSHLTLFTVDCGVTNPLLVLEKKCELTQQVFLGPSAGLQSTNILVGQQSLRPREKRVG